MINLKNPAIKTKKLLNFKRFNFEFKILLSLLLSVIQKKLRASFNDTEFFCVYLVFSVMGLSFVKRVASF